MGTRTRVRVVVLGVGVAAAVAVPLAVGASNRVEQTAVKVSGTLRIVVVGEAHGSVVSTPKGIDCRPTPEAPRKGCKKAFALDVKPKDARYPVKLTFRADEGYRLVTDLRGAEAARLTDGGGTAKVAITTPLKQERSITVRWEALAPPTETGAG